MFRIYEHIDTGKTIQRNGNRNYTLDLDVLNSAFYRVHFDGLSSALHLSSALVLWVRCTTVLALRRVGMPNRIREIRPNREGA